MTKKEECLQAYRAWGVDMWKGMQLLTEQDCASVGSYRRPSAARNCVDLPKPVLVSLQVHFGRGGSVNWSYLSNLHLQYKDEHWTPASTGYGGVSTSRIKRWEVELHARFPSFASLQLFGQRVVISQEPGVAEREWAKDIGVSYGIAREYGDYQFTFRVCVPATKQIPVVADDLVAAQRKAIEMMAYAGTVDVISPIQPDELTELEAKRVHEQEG